MNDIKLESERLIIRRFLPKDWEDLYEYLSSPEAVKYEPYDVFTKQECIDTAKSRAESPAFWAVCKKQSGKLIGNLYFSNISPENFGTWEIGYVFNPKYWGKGYATEACRRLLDYAFSSLNARRITAGCNVLNTASYALLERLGFRREAHHLKEIYFKKDENGYPIWVDSYKYAILKDEWEK